MQRKIWRVYTTTITSKKSTSNSFFLQKEQIKFCCSIEFKFFDWNCRNRRRKRKDITLSKTRELGSTIESEQFSEGLTEEEVRTIRDLKPRRSHKNNVLYFQDLRILKQLQKVNLFRFTSRNRGYRYTCRMLVSTVCARIKLTYEL
jgi:hypothetical protein